MTARKTTTKKSTAAASARAKPKAKPAARSARSRVEPALAGLARTVALNRPEFPSFLKHLGLPEPSILSPFPGLLSGDSKGQARDIDAIGTDLRGLSNAAAQHAFSPMAVPDRILDLRATVFNGAPSPARLYASREFEGHFAGIRPGTEFDYELMAPFTDDDLEVWVRLQLQFSTGSELPLVENEMTAHQFAFLLALADAYKLAFARSFTIRRSEPAPMLITMADILEAELLARTQPDRRWIAHAVGELFGVMLHPGGATGLTLPSVTEPVATAEIRRYVAEGFMSAERRGANPSLELGPTLSMFAASLFSWISLLSMHDMQVLGYSNGSPQAQEEAIAFVVTQPTIWALATEGLTRAEGDLSGVKFGLRSLDLMSALQLTRDFLLPAPEPGLPADLYAPAPMQATTELPAVYEEPAWQSTHTIPAGGLRAWEAPDPSRPHVTEVAAGLEVQVVERTGAWAKVVFSNGWSAWVDGRELMEVSK